MDSTGSCLPSLQILGFSWRTEDKLGQEWETNEREYQLGLTKVKYTQEFNMYSGAKNSLYPKCLT
jgi:hypothetical protein